MEVNKATKHTGIKGLQNDFILRLGTHLILSKLQINMTYLLFYCDNWTSSSCNNP